MRIFIIHNLYQHKGGEDVVVDNEFELLATSHEVQKYTVKNAKGSKGLRQFASYLWNRSEANRITKEIQAFRPDVIHLHNLHYSIGPFLIRRIKKLGIPLAMTLHNYRLVCPSATLFHNGRLFTESLQQSFPWTAVRLKVLDNSFFKTFYTAFTYYFHRKIGTFNLVDRYLVLSQFAKQTLLSSKLGLPEEKFAVKPNFVPEPSTHALETPKSFIYIGRLSEEKGIIPLLKSFEGTDFPLKVFGTGPQQAEVEALANSNANIVYYGYREHAELLNHLHEAEALIVPSICYEGMPMTILDAYALGVPVIASNIGILAEMVVPLYTGYLYDPFEKADVLEKVNLWLNSEESDKQQIKQNCRAEYLYKYTSDLNKALLEVIYQQVIR
ncbi:glycosyltransferase family 4 protein [Sphingobacterium hungaricum]|nr:glycosyltransferase family 4 protein [Sphingobacterium hungaricum]